MARDVTVSQHVDRYAACRSVLPRAQPGFTTGENSGEKSKLSPFFLQISRKSEISNNYPKIAKKEIAFARVLQKYVFVCQKCRPIPHVIAKIWPERKTYR